MGRASLSDPVPPTPTVADAPAAKGGATAGGGAGEPGAGGPLPQGEDAPGFTLRDAGPGDGAAIAAFWNPMITGSAVTFNPDAKSPAEIEAMAASRQAAGHAFLLAVDAGGTVLGFATYAQFRGGAGYGRTMEHTIILTPAAQGRGVGRALMAAIEVHARAAGVHSLIAGVSAENPAGRAFHAAVGFAEIAVLPQVGHKFGRWMDLILMQKILD